MLCVHFQNYHLLVLHSLLFFIWNTNLILILGFLRQDIQKCLCSCSRFAVMAYCWAMSGDERPTFSQLHICLQEFYTQLTRYVWQEFIIVLLMTWKGTCRPQCTWRRKGKWQVDTVAPTAVQFSVLSVLDQETKIIFYVVALQLIICCCDLF